MKHILILLSFAPLFSVAQVKNKLKINGDTAYPAPYAAVTWDTAPYMRLTQMKDTTSPFNPWVKRKVKKPQPFRWPKPIEYSKWVEYRYDTTYGVLQYEVGNGKVIGEGILVNITLFHNSKPVYSVKDQQKIDRYYAEMKKGKELFFFSGLSGYSNSGESVTVPYIRTAKGYQYVDKRFVFTPHIKSSWERLWDIVINTITK